MNLQNFILVASPFRSVESEHLRLLELIGMIRWTAVLDFDMATENKGGLLCATEAAINAQLSMNVQRMLPSEGDNSKNNKRMGGKESNQNRVSWLFVRGNEARPDTLAKDYRDWLRRYCGKVDDRLKEIANNQCGITPTTFLVVWDDHEEKLLDYLLAVLQRAMGSFGAKLRFVFVGNPRLFTPDHERFHRKFVDLVEQLLDEESNVGGHQPFRFSPVEVCRHLRSHILSAFSDAEKFAVKIPITGDGPDPFLDQLPEQDLRYVQEELEIVPANIHSQQQAGSSTPERNQEKEKEREKEKEGDEVGAGAARGSGSRRERGPRDFFLGKDCVSWEELDADTDVKRDVHEGMYVELKRMLEGGGGQMSVVFLYHVPGAGGTTVARRLLYTFRSQYPCAICKSSDLQEVAKRVAFLSDFSKRAVLVLLDGLHLSAFDLWNIVVNELKQKVVVLNVQRVHQLSRFIQAEKGKLVAANAITERSTVGWELDRKLAFTEANRFYRRYSLVAENQEEFMEVYGWDLDEFKERFRENSRQPYLYTPFYFAFYAFKRGFKGLFNFVESHIQSMKDHKEGREILVCVFLVILC